MDDSDGDDGIEAVVSVRKTDVVADHGLVVSAVGNVDEGRTAIRADLVNLFVDSEVLAVATAYKREKRRNTST